MNSLLNPREAFTLTSTPTSTQIHDSLRLGHKIEALQTLNFGGSQSSGPGCILKVRPTGIYIIDDPKEGGEALYFWGKCHGLYPLAGDDLEPKMLNGHVFGRVNVYHKRGTLMFSDTPFGLDQVLAFKEPTED